MARPGPSSIIYNGASGHRNGIQLQQLNPEHKEENDHTCKNLIQGIVLWMQGISSYDCFAIKPEKGSIPIQHTHAGLKLLIERIGSKRIIFIKDEDEL